MRRDLSISREIGYPQAVNDVDRGPASILIADDLPDLLEALKETLEREGFIVTAVPDGESALAGADPRRASLTSR